MRFVYIVILLVILAFGFSGCKGEETTNQVNSESTVNADNEVSATTQSIETAVEDSSTSKTDESNTQEEVIIKAYYEKPPSLNDKNTILLEGLVEGEEYIEVIVKGEIINFEQIELTWDENKNELSEKRIIKSIEKLANQTLVVKTYQPEGIPSEKLKWKSRTGKSYEYIISEKSLGDTDNITTKYELNENGEE